MPPLKALLGDRQGLPLKLSSPIFVYLAAIIQILPQVPGTHRRASCLFQFANLWKDLRPVVFNISILQRCANGIFFFSSVGEPVEIASSCFRFVSAEISFIANFTNNPATHFQFSCLTTHHKRFAIEHNFTSFVSR